MGWEGGGGRKLLIKLQLGVAMPWLLPCLIKQFQAEIKWTRKQTAYQVGQGAKQKERETEKKYRKRVTLFWLLGEYDVYQT